MDSFVRFAAAASRATGVLAATLIVLSVLVVCHMVVARYFFGQPTVWQTEFVVYALIATTLVGSPYVLLHRGHVNMDILVLYASQRLRFWLAVAAGAISILFCGLLFVYGLAFWYEAWASDWRSDTVNRVPLWLPYLSLPVGMGLLTVQLAADLACVMTGRDLPFGLPPRDAAPGGLVHAEPAAMLAATPEPRQ